MADVSSWIVLAESATYREKVLKALQYGAKLGVAVSPDAQPLLSSVAKSIGSARRLVCFLRWVKYFDDYRAACGERDEWLRALLMGESLLNIVVDGMQDVATLHRLGLLGPLGQLLPARFEQAADRLDSCNLALGLVGAAVKLRRVPAPAPLELAAGSSGKDERRAQQAAERHKRTKAQVALLKYGLDLCKAVDAAGGSLPGARLAAFGGLASSLLSAAKLREKLAPPPPPLRTKLS